ncbi:MAG TPA: polyprenyl diphosphate synthase [bacterium]|nr:polyprenyl diphosphate synthase [bacterium]
MRRSPAQALGLRRGRLPRHIGLILDGNRRYAREAGLSGAEVYRLGAGKIDDVLQWSHTLGISEVTVWVLSIDNLERPPDEVEPFLRVIEAKLRELARHPATIACRRHIRAVGRLSVLPASLRQAIDEAERATADHTRCQLNLAVGYSGRQEIADAVVALIRARLKPGMTVDELVAEATPEEIGQRVYANGSDDPDLIIRTSGEIKLSGFLLWQGVYSEYYFCDVPWPVFRRVDLLRALRSYQHRDRRFGV